MIEEDYFSLMLFGMLNPVLASMRSLSAASHLKRSACGMSVYGRKASLGSFSEAQGVFDPELFKGVFLDLAAENRTSWGDARFAPLADKIKLVDGTLVSALTRMHCGALHAQPTQTTANPGFRAGQASNMPDSSGAALNCLENLEIDFCRF